jgi:hypothetical protein
MSWLRHIAMMVNLETKSKRFSGRNWLVVGNLILIRLGILLPLFPYEVVSPSVFESD